MIGWLAIGVFVWLSEHKKQLQIVAMVTGLLICYVFGTFWYVCMYAKEQTGIMAIFSVCVLPFIIPDLVKMALAYNISKKIKKYLANV